MTAVAAGTSVSAARRGLSRPAALGLMLAGLLVVCAASLLLGARTIAPGTVVDALTHYSGTDDELVIRSLRAPRTLLGLAVGVALGVAGALIQAVTRNPLGDTQVLGVNSGAGLAVVFAVGLGGAAGLWTYVWFAFAGAAVALVAVYGLGAARRGGATPVSLTLAGIALGAAMDGVSGAVRLLRPRAFDNLRYWDIGTLAGRPLDVAVAVMPFVVVGLVIAAFVARSLNATDLGDDLARALGARLHRTRALTAVAVVLLAGAATAAAGPIGFVGLLVAHLVRPLAGPDHRWRLAFTAVGGPLLVLSADVVGRLVIRPGELPVGVVTALVGAPVLIWVIRRDGAARRAPGWRRPRHPWPRWPARPARAVPAPVAALAGPAAVPAVAGPRRRGGVVLGRPGVDFGRATLLVRAGALSARVDTRAAVVSAGVALVALAVGVVALGTGSFHVSPGDVLRALTGAADSATRLVVIDWRLPRVLLGLVVGAALGLAGSVFQTLTRNPLGSPDIIGFNTGAYTAVLLVIVASGPDYYTQAAGALVGGFATAAVVYLLSLRRGVVSAQRLVVVGIAVGATLTAVNQWLLVKVRLSTAIAASVWGQGSLSGLGFTVAIPVVVTVAVLAAALAAVARFSAVLELGDDAAAGLGVRVGPARLAVLGLGVALTAVTTAAAGPVSFVALAAPHLARLLARRGGLVPAAATGALLMVAADWVAQRLFAPSQLPVGVVTVSLGGAYLVVLLATRSRERTG